MAKAKLSDEQKEANKKVLSERRQAYNARKMLYDAEMAAAKEAAEEQPEYAAKQDASTAFRTAQKQRDEAIQAVDEQIEKLEAQRKELQSLHQLAVDEANDLHRAARTAYATTFKRFQQEVIERYPDMVDCWNLKDCILRTSHDGLLDAQLGDCAPLENQCNVIAVPR